MKYTGLLFVFLSVSAQLASIFVFYAVFYGIGRIFHEPLVSNHGDGMDFYALTLIRVGFFVLFYTIIVTSAREVTKSELLAAVMHSVAIIFLWSDTFNELLHRPFDYGLILVCITCTLPVRLLFRKQFYG